ncbi:DUF6318 family protein [Cellulomonas biazotea]|uniref:DUF6318 domain-containing protein n=1 Tax=Cellulomonas biazotea TaxID=1709 RepID=A0A402DUV6_9CELL|nr:hypothetical protein CBZ_29950 [Cellulomonas biazotea]
MTRPERPAAMETPSAEGAAAAAAYFVELYGYTWATGDTSLWSAMSAETCEFCSAVLDRIAEMKAANYHSTGARTVVTSATGTEIRADEWYSASLVASQDSSSTLDSDGEVVATSDPGTYDLFVAIGWSQGWKVSAIDWTERPS